METKQNRMIMWTLGGSAILSSGVKTDPVTGIFLPKALHEQLKISLPERHFTVEASAGDVLFIVSERHKISRVMVLQLKHTAVGPLPGILQAATNTLAAGDLDQLILPVRVVHPGIRRRDNVILHLASLTRHTGGITQKGMITRQRSHLPSSLRIISQRIRSIREKR